LGFQPDVKVTNMIVPSFELTFFPGFVTKVNDNKANAIQISVLLGIH
ncbi:MAG: hypothetical protein GQ525_04125, partial [Draconibacterium sp.]|nr:hypothetical protein [Draconibacterium sp.]